MLGPITITDAAIGWAHNPVLREVSLSFPWRGLVCVSGPIGSGKSTLLSAITGEANVISGSVHHAPDLKLAYCPQLPWILHDSLRSNIILGRPLVSEQ